MESVRTEPGMSQAIEQHLPLSLSSLFVFTDYMRSYRKLEIAISSVLFFSQPFWLADKSEFQSCSFFLQHYKCLFCSSAIWLGSPRFKYYTFVTLASPPVQFSTICAPALLSEFKVNRSSQGQRNFSLNKYTFHIVCQ